MTLYRAVDAVPATALATWPAEAGLSGAAAEPQANPAGDGVPNLLKYASNLNPSTVDQREMQPGGTAGLPHVVAASVKGLGAVEITFLKRIGGGLKYTVERSGPGLQGWEPVPGTARDTVVSPGWESCTVSVARGTGVKFLRVAVTLSGG
jgi:hypothetical protein